MTYDNHLFKMVCALNLMINNTNKRLGRSRVTNRKYDASRFYANVQFSEEHRRKISEAARRRDPATRKQTAEANEKRRQFMREYKKTPEHIAKQAESQRGQARGSWGSHSEETKEKLRAIHLGKPKSQEARRKMSEAKLGKKYGPRGPYRKTKIPNQ
jgi:N-acyl-D-aspartate/D-glutamate deacylase